MKTLKELATEIGELVAQKQEAYGDSFSRSGECLRQMYPDGIKPTQYDDVLTIARILDKLFRLANDPTAFGENPYRDINGYSLLGVKRYEDSAKYDAPCVHEKVIEDCEFCKTRPF